MNDAAEPAAAADPAALRASGRQTRMSLGRRLSRHPRALFRLDAKRIAEYLDRRAQLWARTIGFTVRVPAVPLTNRKVFAQPPEAYNTMTGSPRIVTLELHSAGATVLHTSPFKDLEVPVDPVHLSAEMRDRWVMPFYMACLQNVDEMEALLGSVFHEITPSMVNVLLSQFNWRPRIAGAYFTALLRFGTLEQIIGRLLLRSDVCFAGRGYCLALARLNTPTAVDYLREYLSYYLTRAELWFDQQHAMAALTYLDRANSTAYADDMMSLWTDFVRDQPNWNLSKSCGGFAGNMQALEEICSRMPHAFDAQSKHGAR